MQTTRFVSDAASNLGPAGIDPQSFGDQLNSIISKKNTEQVLLTEKALSGLEPLIIERKCVFVDFNPQITQFPLAFEAQH